MEKLCPVLFRNAGMGRELLVFRHPSAGIQLVKGTREAGEPREAGALRELAEESGISTAVVIGELGASATIAAGEVWHFVQVQAGPLPDRWDFDTAGGGGLRFSFFWWPLGDDPGPDWPLRFVRALHHIRARAGFPALEGPKPTWCYRLSTC